MLYDTLKKQIPVFMKTGNKDLNILKLVISDCDRIIANNGMVTDSQVINIMKKLVASNEETYKARQNQTLLDENTFLLSYIPKELSIEEVRKILDPYKEEFLSYSNNGVAIKTTISQFPNLPAKHVSQIVREVRNEHNR
jgi:uncharacterized protein YqeY